MSNNYRLLMVEDSADDAEFLLYSLRNAEFKVVAVRVETEPDYLAELDANPPDVVVCDYHLPRFDATRAMQILTERKIDIPFILVSHHIGEDATVAALQSGASDYLLKGRLDRLPKAIESAIERCSSRRQKVAAENALRTSEAMKRSILNSLNTRIAVVDGQGVILATNKSWDRFNEMRQQLYGVTAAHGASYVDMLREVAQRSDDIASRGQKLIKSVISREAEFGSMEYELPLPGGRRWYVARVMPLEDSINGAVISHEDVTDHMLAHHALGEANKRLQGISKRMLSIQEDERRSISRELHDDIGQSLTALKIGLHRISSRVGAENAQVLAECLAIADSTLDKLRNLSLELRPPQLDQLGLEEALQWLADRQRNATGLAIECKFAGLTVRLPPDLESVCYRITQEALNNATRHARARHIGVRIELVDRLLKLVIHDDGTGFDMDTARRKALKTGSMGLISMEERAQLAGGRLKVRTVPGAGTTVQVAFVLDDGSVPAKDAAGELIPGAMP